LKESIVEGRGIFDLVDRGTEYIYTEVPSYRDDIRGVRGEQYKLIERGTERIATRVDGSREEVVSLNEVPAVERERLVSEIEREFDAIEVAADVGHREFREDLAALGYLEK
jgi:hypothetical protein